MISTKLFKEFFESERSGGFVLVVFTILAMAIANSVWGEAYLHSLHQSFLGLSIEHWVNDGLMAIFFFMVGLELEREIYQGELSSIRNSLLPIAAAVGGMVVPALIHFLLNHGLPTQRGAGIPMATDIAFSLGVLSLFSDRVPLSLKVFLTALAIADDLGAVVVIAIFYSNSISVFYLMAAVGTFLSLCTMNRLRVDSLIVYISGGIILWYFTFQSGVHATISGVMLAFALPFGDGSEASLSYRVQHWLHRPVAFLVLPIFALVNTAIPLSSDWASGLLEWNSLGIMIGLILGKPIGILACCYVFLKLKVVQIPPGITWSHIIGAAFLSGIGFTMSIFVSILAFNDPQLVNSSQIAVLFASLIAAVCGSVWFSTRVDRIAIDID